MSKYINATCPSIFIYKKSGLAISRQSTFFSMLGMSIV